MRLLLGMDGFFYLSFPGKQVYWMVAENGRFESMKQKKEREKEILYWLCQIPGFSPLIYKAA